MTSKTKTEEFLRATELPEQTESYTVISHGFIIDTMREIAEKEGFEIEQDLYKAGEKGNEALGFTQLKTISDPDMGMSFNWTNSYNKKLRFSCSIGGFIYDNKVPFICSTNSANWMRKHTGTALDEARQVIVQMISQAKEHFNNIIDMKNRFIDIEIDKQMFGELMGALYFELDYMSSEQVNLMKREYEKPTHDYKHKGTLWEFYKMLMFSVREQDPTRWYTQQLKLNTYIITKFNLHIDGTYLTRQDIETVDSFDNEEMLGSNLSDEQIQMIEEDFGVVKSEQEQPTGSFFDSIEKKNPLTPSESFVKGTIEEREEAMCDNCGSLDVFVNASAQLICDNCGHEEDTGLGDSEEEEFEEIMEEEEETVVTEEEEEDYVPWHKKIVTTTSNETPLGIIDPNEPGAGSHNPDNPKPEEVDVDDAFELEDEEDTEEVSDELDGLLELDDETQVEEKKPEVDKDVQAFISKHYKNKSETDEIHVDNKGSYKVVTFTTTGELFVI